MSKEKLAYFINGTQVRIVLHTADAKAEISPADTVSEMNFDANDFGHEFQSSDGAKTLLAYGLVKILQDRTSQVTESIAKKFEAMQAEADRLTTQNEDGSYNWKNVVVREKSAPRSTKKVDSYLAQAIAQLKNISVSAATEAVKALDVDKVAAMMANPKVKEIMDVLKEQAKKEAESNEFDLADLLA